MALATQKGPLVAINMTPLVDVMLVLLAIFMLTARLADETTSVPLDLPEAASGAEIQGVLHIGIDAQGRRLVDGRPVRDEAQLQALAQARRRDNPQLRTVIEAARTTDHVHVVDTLDALRLVGVYRIAFAVVPEEAQSAGAPGAAEP